VEHEGAGHVFDRDLLPGEPLREVVAELVGEFDRSVRRLDDAAEDVRLVVVELAEVALDRDSLEVTVADGDAALVFGVLLTGVEDRVGQRVKYATSADGLDWTEPAFLTPVPPDSGPDSPHYNTRTDEGYRYISRGFWVRDGELLALASLDEAAGFFGESLELHAFQYNPDTSAWDEPGVVYDNAINNFPPKQIPSGEWMMSRRTYDRDVHFLVGGVDAFNQWESYPVVFYGDESLAAEEPYWWVLPDENLLALFRDNNRSGFLFRSFSTDNGRTWHPPVKTNFPDATSKFNGTRLSDGRYVLVSNANPDKRDPLVLSISEDGMVFNKMGYLVGGRWVDYPHVIEHDGHLFVAFAGWKKQTCEVLKIHIADLDVLDVQE